MNELPNWAQRRFKIFQRDKLFPVGLGPKVSYLTLPGDRCVDIQYALDRGILTSDTQITAVERETEIFNKMCNWFVNNWKSSVPPKLINANLSQVTDLDSTDLVFLDYLGNVTAPDASWIRNYLCPVLMPNAYLGMTVAKATRANRFIPAVYEMLLKRFHDYYFQTSIRVRDKMELVDVDLLKTITTYSILINCYLFEDFTYKLAVDYYPPEDGSPHVMILFRLLDINQQINVLTDEEIAVRNAIGKLVKKYKSTREVAVKAIEVPLLTSEKVIETVQKSIECPTSKLQKLAEQMLERYAMQRSMEGFNGRQAAAGIKATVTRRLNNLSKEKVV